MSDPLDALAALTADYRQKLPRRRRALAALWARLPHDDEQLGVCSELRLQVHRLAGSAGAFGFDALSRAARRVDQILKGWLLAPPASRPPRSRLIEELAQPFADLLAVFGEDAAASAEETAAAPVSGRALRLIHVEDDLDQAALLRLRLERLGLCVHVAADAEALFEALPRVRPDAVLLDYWLGGENGADLARAIRSTPGCETLPLLCLTSDIGDRVRLDALAAGCDEVMSKVQSAAQLAAAICAWVAGVVPER
ncbi:MAG: response regulator [Xanthomonadales bacterium]|nr:response regulator [Xanthomonadales bacterium]